MNVAERLAAVEAEIAAACARSNRERCEVRLVAVSKFQPAQAIAEAARAGQNDFGENYVQEAEAKKELLARDGIRPRWHMTGHIQSRKAGIVAGAYDLIHTLDSARLARALARRLDGSRQKVLIEVNIGEERQKSGVLPGELKDLALLVVRECPQLDLRGLMCLPPVFDAGEAARPFFARLRGLAAELRDTLGLPLPELSMGMSGDFAAAISEGATIVRIGTAIFGPRPLKQTLTI